MSKHEAERDSSPYSKRLRLSKSEGKSTSHHLEANINSWKDLQLLLAFTQDSGPEKRQQIRQFKLFLNSIAHGEDRDAAAARSNILLAYLQSQSQPRYKEKTKAAYFSDLIQTWSFAAQSDNENLFSSIAGVLALFFKVTSSSLEFRDIGNQLCQTLLEDEQLKLFERGLSTNRFKEHVASPCLRLLMEVTSHDGGAAAGIIWRKRDVTFKSLDAFIRMRKDPVGLQKDAKRAPSIRNISLRYLFANLRLQSPAAKAGILILAQGKLARAVFQDIKRDPPAIVSETLQIFKTYVLLDDKLPQHIKKHVFREGTLLCIASLHNYNEPDVASEEQIAVRQAAHTFLLFACTSDKAEILEAIKPVQPKSSKLADESSHTASWTSILNATTPTNQVKHTSFKNVSISLFLQGLRPFANVMDKDLIIAIFDAAPGLLGDYFERKKSFSFEPKLTATWLGYSMFLLSTVQLPLTDRYLETLQRSGTTLAIPASTIIETILPTPLTHKSLTRCLNQQVDLIAFMTLKILIAAFQKLQSLLQWLQNTGYQSPAAARHATAELKAEFRTRCPDMRHVIAGFRKCPTGNVALREAYAQLVALYYSIVPQAALDEKFDISIALSDILLGNEPESQGAKGGLNSLNAEHLQQIAHYSPDMRWLYKPGTALPFCV